MNQITEASNEEAKLAQDVTSIIETLDEVSIKLSTFVKEML